MANGRLKKEPGYCDYEFTDGTYCKEKIAGEFLHESGKKIKRTGWEDKEKRNYCLFHSHNDDKGEVFYPEIKKRIDNANDSVKNKLAELDKKQLSKEEKKNQEKEIRDENILDFEGFYFPIRAYFENTIFEASINFLNVEFGGEAYFRWVRFGGDVKFESAIFSGVAIFWRAEFGGVAHFEGVNFGGNADFVWAKFGGAAHFESANFNGKADFEWAKFGGVACFEEVKFGAGAHFRGSTFSVEAHFERSTFGGETHFLQAKFGGETHFLQAKFGGEARFGEVTFGGKARFGSATFGGLADFNWTKFGVAADFECAKFGGVARFEEATFGREANFSWATFGEKVTFWGAEFFGGATFKSATFSGEADFNQSLFNQSTNFTRAACLKKLDFTDAAFLSGKLDFTRARFPTEETIFHNTVFNCEVLFNEQMLKGVRFTGCYLGSASFYDSDVRDAVFINSSWNRRFLKKQIQNLIKQERIGKDTPVLEISKILTSGKRRAVLLDEYIYQYSKSTSTFEKIKIWLSFGFTSSCRGIKSCLKNLLKKQKGITLSCYNLDPSRLDLDPLYLEQLYCQFKLAMDRNKMYGLANDFYHGEKLMETKRLWEERSFPSFLKWAFLWLYRLLAGFGNSPWRAVISLILILFTSSYLLIKFNGLTVTDSKEAFKRCPCKSEEKIKTVTTKPDPIQAAALAKVERSFVSGNMTGLIVFLNTLNKFSKESKPGEIPGTGPPKIQTEYSLKCNYLCNVFFVSLWNLTATPGGRSDYYREKGLVAYLAVFCIQYIFRPLMVALIIISVRRKVHRG